MKRVLAAIILLVGASCGPKVRSFVISPRNVCRGGESTVFLDVRGTPRLLVRHGRAEDSPDEPDTVTLVLKVLRGRDSVTQLQDILEFPPRFNHTVAVEAVSEGNDVVGRDTANPGLWPAAFVVQSVRSPSGRQIIVRHADRSATLPADGSPSDALRGTALAGEWELRSPVGSGEAPDRLRLSATVNCVQ